ncbi:hypothetical protein BDV11DRAFT_188726 [Aspergillus similis]
MDLEDPSFFLQDDLFQSIESELSDQIYSDENILIPLTDASRNPLKVLKLEYSNNLPEYLLTDLNGYGYVINIQYCTQQKYRNRPCSQSSFLGTSYLSSSYQCSGVKICEHASIQLKNMHHTCLTDDLWTTLQDIRHRISEIEKDATKDAAYRYKALSN